MTAEENYISLDKQDKGVVILTLNRPDSLNALTGDFLVAILNTLKSLEHDQQVNVVIITGAGRGFCSGADLVNGPLLDDGFDIEHWINQCANPVVEFLRSMSKPVIAAVNGSAAGAGFSVALACDVIFSAQSAKYILSFAKIGMAMDMGASWFLTHRIGPMRTAAISMSAQPIDAKTVQQWGLSYELVDDEQLLPRCVAFAQQLSAMPATALAAIKAQISYAGDASLTQTLGNEARTQGELIGSEAAQTLIKAFAS